LEDLQNIIRDKGFASVRRYRLFYMQSRKDVNVDMYFLFR